MRESLEDIRNSPLANDQNGERVSNGYIVTQFFRVASMVPMTVKEKLVEMAGPKVLDKAIPNGLTKSTKTKPGFVFVFLCYRS